MNRQTSCLAPASEAMYLDTATRAADLYTIGSGFKQMSFKLLLVLLTLIGVVSILNHPRPLDSPRNGLFDGAQITSGVLAVVDRACRDCHSDRTRYPWYSYIAPISWLVERDVAEGRQHLNLSRWGEYSVLRKERCLSEIANQVEDGGMPLRPYTFVHRSARLSPADVDILFEWTQAERARLIAGSRTNK